MVRNLKQEQHQPSNCPNSVMTNFSVSVILIAQKLPGWNPQMPAWEGGGGGGGLVLDFEREKGGGAQKGQEGRVW